MAEFVQLRKEKWTEPLKLLTQLDLLSAEELRSVTGSLDKFQYKIQTQHRKLEDILEFIQFECNILIMIKQRRKEYKQTELTEEVDRFIYNEIRSQFGTAEISFRHRVEFWNAKLRFITDIVPDQDKESEFNLLFKKAIDNCGKTNLGFYKECVDFLWTFARKAPLVIHPGKRKKSTSRRNVAKLMDQIRNYTNHAIQNFKGDPDASIWFLTTELKYLEVLREEQEYRDDNRDAYFPYDIDEEALKAEKLIDIIFRNLLETQAKSPQVYIKLYEAVKRLPLSEAGSLARKAYNAVLSMKERGVDVYGWLLGRSIDDERPDEFIERVNQALSCSLHRVKMLEMCIDKIDSYISNLEIHDLHNSLPKILRFYSQLVDVNNLAWNLVASEKLQSSRLNLIKYVANYLEKSRSSVYDADLQSFLDRNKTHQVVEQLHKQFPSSFILSRAKILESLKPENLQTIKSTQIIKILQDINWTLSEPEPAAKLLHTVYYAFLVAKKLSKKINKFLMLPPQKIPVMNDIRLGHMKKLYFENGEDGRAMYKKFKNLTSDWRFPCQAIKVETNFAKADAGNDYSDILLVAYEDAIRLAGSEIEPWKVCYESKCALGEEKAASRLLEQAKAHFSAMHKSDSYQELLSFSKRFVSSSGTLFFE